MGIPTPRRIVACSDPAMNLEFRTEFTQALVKPKASTCPQRRNPLSSFCFLLTATHLGNAVYMVDGGGLGDSWIQAPTRALGQWLLATDLYSHGRTSTMVESPIVTGDRENLNNF
jgi:hypothetical protein